MPLNGKLVENVKDIVRNNRGVLHRRRWESGGKPVPAPSIVKQGILRGYIRQHGLKVFIESGTFKGSTSAALRKEVNRIITMEVFEPLYLQAIERFRAFTHVECYLGDSRATLRQVLPTLNEPALFWLDGHFSGSGTGMAGDIICPTIDELHIIKELYKGKGVILVDDARLFGTDKGYPDLESLLNLIRELFPGSNPTVETDIVRAVIA